MDRPTFPEDEPVIVRTVPEAEWQAGQAAVTELAVAREEIIRLNQRIAVLLDLLHESRARVTGPTSTNPPPNRFPDSLIFCQ